MTSQSLLEILDALRNGIDPRTGELYNQRDTCLDDPVVHKGIMRLRKHLLAPVSLPTVNIPDTEIETACRNLRTLGYDPSVMQLAKIFIGSRSIVDRNLRGLVAYNRYRGIYTRQRIYKHLFNFHERRPDILREHPRANERTVDEPWRVIPFFDTEHFDKLDDKKAIEIHRAVLALGLRKTTETLPDYMANARSNTPRAYEPWTREEQALLIEAMCYTNDEGKLAEVFGRTANAITKMGKRLIYESQQRKAG
ncbi:MAG: hypothetical protein AAGA62_12655 [Bacteroidota bacterium]